MRNLLSLLALALVLPLAACASEPEVEEVEPMEPEATEMVTEEPAAAEVTVDGTLEAVQSTEGGLLGLPGEAAVANIDGWIAQLSGDEAFAPVVADLEALKAELQQPEIDGAAVGALLLDLGTATTDAAGDNEGLQALGAALTEAGNALTGM